MMHFRFIKYYVLYNHQIETMITNANKNIKKEFWQHAICSTAIEINFKNIVCQLIEYLQPVEKKDCDALMLAMMFRFQVMTVSKKVMHSEELDKKCKLRTLLYLQNSNL